VDFDDTREEAEFRKEVRQWLGANAEPKSGAFETWQSRYAGRDGYEGLERAKEFQAKKADAGFAALHWPVEWGGRALPPIYQVIYSQEETRYLVARGYFEIGLGMCMPTLFAFGTEAQKRRHAPVALRGQEVWCQLFSEPGAGSDLAGLRTRAQRDGDEWVINGQKIWTSGAHWADWAILVARSDGLIAADTLGGRVGLSSGWLC
jgi:alkylation response protein AidB-like acyl-CoA dehydrogenase